MKKRLTMFLTCLFMSLGIAIAQQKITGTVFEDNGEPCIGATVMIQGSKQLYHQCARRQKARI